MLLVEDDSATVDALVARLRSRIPDVELWFAECLEEVAKRLLESTFDAAIVDLRIPSSLGTGDASVEFGKLAEVQIRLAQPGAIRVFMTASEALEVVQQLRDGKSDDFLACGEPFSLVDYVMKGSIDALDDCVAKLEEHWDRLLALDGVRLVDSEDVELDARRALVLAVRAAGGVSGRVVRTSGKSGASTSLVECFDHSGNLVANAFCKVGRAQEIERELAGYKLAEFALPTTAFPKLGRTLEVGVGTNKALVFTRAPSTTSFFDLLRSDPSAACDVVGYLPALFAPWGVARTTDKCTVGAMIDQVLSDETRIEFASILSVLDLTSIRELSVDLLAYCQHGDLHGENMFVLASGEPFLIDFAHTRVQPGPVDPVSLELSLLFHDSSPMHGSLSLAACSKWFSAEPVSPVVVACRRWALDNGHSATDYAVSGLLYALWIVKHATFPAQAAAVAQSALEVLVGDSRLA